MPVHPPQKSGQWRPADLFSATCEEVPPPRPLGAGAHSETRPQAARDDWPHQDHGQDAGAPPQKSGQWRPADLFSATCEEVHPLSTPWGGAHSETRPQAARDVFRRNPAVLREGDKQVVKGSTIGISNDGMHGGAQAGCDDRGAGAEAGLRRCGRRGGGSGFGSVVTAEFLVAGGRATASGRWRR